MAHRFDDTQVCLLYLFAPTKRNSIALSRLLGVEPDVVRAAWHYMDGPRPARDPLGLHETVEKFERRLPGGRGKIRDLAVRESPTNEWFVTIDFPG